jgi:hypothetical protein
MGAFDKKEYTVESINKNKINDPVKFAWQI